MQEKSASVGALSDAFGARATPPSDQSGLRPWSQRERRGRFPRLFSQRRRRRALRPAASASGAAAGLDAARSAVSATVAAISTARADGSRQRFAARQRAPSGLGSVSLGSAALAARLSSARDVSARLPGSLARSSRFQHAALRSRRRSARRSASRQRHAQRRGAAGGRRRVPRRLRRRGRRLIGGERRVRSTPACAAASHRRQLNAPWSTPTVARSKKWAARARVEVNASVGELVDVVNSVKNDSELRFFLAMVEKRPYSSSSNRSRREFFRRESAVNSDELFVAGEVR